MAALQEEREKVERIIDDGELENAVEKEKNKTEHNYSAAEQADRDGINDEEEANKEENGREENRYRKETSGDGSGQKEDLEMFSCLLQPPSADSDQDYIGFRRLLLHRKATAGFDRRKDWRCNGKGYVAFRNYISRPRNWETAYLRSLSSSSSRSGRGWVNPSPTSFSFLFELDSITSSWELRRANHSRASFGSSTSDNSRFDRPHKREEPAYSFVGMHCIFDQCKSSVTVVKFGRMSSDLLAYGAVDGSLAVCTVSDPPKVNKLLIGHSRDVTDFDFTSNNRCIASTSLDKTVRVWDVSKGLCMRVIYGVSSQWCIRFHPVNNNILSVGTGNKEINVYNFSTGRLINRAVLKDEVTAMDHDHTGHLIFCGNAQGSIYTLRINSRTGALSRSHRNKNVNKQKSPVTTVQYRTFSLLAGGPVLLTCTQDGSLAFFGVAPEIQGYLTLRCSLKLTPRVHRIHASFCPLLSLEKGEYIVAGSEDSNVYFYDLTRPRQACVNKLQGHGAPVIGISWNHGENLLASSDSVGTVIVWKRAKTG